MAMTSVVVVTVHIVKATVYCMYLEVRHLPSHLEQLQHVVDEVQAKRILGTNFLQSKAQLHTKSKFISGAGGEGGRGGGGARGGICPPRICRTPQDLFCLIC